jgi:hypothetical protein
MSNNTVSFTVFLKDAFSSPLAKITSKSDAAFSRISKDFNKIANSGRTASRSLEQIDQKLNALTEARYISLDTKYIKKATKDIKALELQRDKLTGSSASGSGLGMLGGYFAPVAIAAGAVGLAKSIYTVRSEREKLQTVLATTFQDSDKAEIVMEKIKDFATRTPFQVTQLSEAFVKLTNQGMEPTMDQMTKMGDLASSTGKNFDQLAEAVLDARMGEYERLKEFGIKAQDSGNKVVFTFKGVRTEVEKNSKAIGDYLVGLGAVEGVSGSMANISQTLSGKVSNLADSWDNLLETIGKSDGVFSKAIEGLTSLLGGLNELLEKNTKKEKRALPGASSVFGTGGLETIGNQIGDLTLNNPYLPLGTLVGANNYWTKQLNREKEGEIANTKMDKYFELFDKEATTKAELVKGEKELLTYLGKEFGAETQQKFRAEYEKAMNVWKKGTKKENSTTTPTSTGLNSGVSNVSGNASVKNITITVNKMVGVETLSTSTFKESESDIGAAVDKVLLTALNDANRVVE